MVKRASLGKFEIDQSNRYSGESKIDSRLADVMVTILSLTSSIFRLMTIIKRTLRRSRPRSTFCLSARRGVKPNLHSEVQKVSAVCYRNAAELHDPGQIVSNSGDQGPAND